MSQVAIVAADGHTTSVDSSAFALLARAIHGQVLPPSAMEYHKARTLWNAMIDRHPAVVIRCTEPTDVCESIKFAREHNLLISVRSGGHNIAGNACCQGGMMIDLSTTKMIMIDPMTSTCMANAGLTLGEFDAACQKYEFATPTGINSTTGIAGLTLGGGFGWLSRKYGLTIDNLRSAKVVTAEGKLVTANSMENTDLFWAIRGGGGNFGIATSFTFKLHTIGTQVLSGLVVHPFGNAQELLKFYREYCETLPDEVTVWCVMRKAPPLPFLPEEWHGKLILAFAACYVGKDMAAGEAALKPLREHGSPIADVIAPHNYLDWQQTFDPLLTPGARNYWKSNNFDELSDGAINVIIDAVSNLPSDHSEVFIGQMGGATARVAPDATAYADRNVKFIMNVHGRWTSQDEDQGGIDWCKKLYEATEPFSTGGVYINFMTGEETSRVEKAYGPNFARLQELKRKWDPTNVFRLNQNICP